jgi:hypothetical protein
MKKPLQAAVAAALGLMLSAVVLAQGGLAEPGLDVPSKSGAAQVTANPAAPVTITRGKPSRVGLSFRVAKGLHINSNKPNTELLIPTALKFSPPTDILVGKVIYPPGQDMSFAFSPKEKLNVYTGAFTATVLLSAARSASPGIYRVRGELKYQACDNQQCFPPRQLPLAFDVKVVKSVAARSPRRNPGQSPHVHR